MGETTCACSHKMAPTEQGKFLITCPACKRQLLPALSNKITLLLKEQIHEYYNNNFKCKCGKQYCLNPLGDCCKIKFKPRSNIPFDLHELVYLTKDLCMTSRRDAVEDTKRRLDLL